jgi:hypothetical protein
VRRAQTGLRFQRGNEPPGLHNRAGKGGPVPSTRHRDERPRVQCLRGRNPGNRQDDGRKAIPDGRGPGRARAGRRVLREQLPRPLPPQGAGIAPRKGEGASTRHEEPGGGRSAEHSKGLRERGVRGPEGRKPQERSSGERGPAHPTQHAGSGGGIPPPIDPDRPSHDPGGRRPPPERTGVPGPAFREGPRDLGQTGLPAGGDQVHHPAGQGPGEDGKPETPGARPESGDLRRGPPARGSEGEVREPAPGARLPGGSPKRYPGQPQRVPV